MRRETQREDVPGRVTSGIFRPRLAPGRLLAGFLAGWTGGVVLGFPFYAILLREVELVTGPLSAGLFWILHMTISTAAGVLFSVFVAPRSFPTSLAAALAFVLLGVYAHGHAILVWRTGAPIPLDAAAFVVIGAHVVYAIVLGAGYVALHRAQLRDAAEAHDARWRAWARREARAS